MSSLAVTYRSIVRETNRSVSTAASLYETKPNKSFQSVSARATRNKVIASNFRALFEKHREGNEKEGFEYDMQNAVTLMLSQRIHKVRTIY